MAAERREQHGRQMGPAHAHRQPALQVGPQRREVRSSEDECVDRLWAHLELMEREFNSSVASLKWLISTISSRSNPTTTNSPQSHFGGRLRQQSKQLTRKQIHLHIRPHSSGRGPPEGQNHPILLEQDDQWGQNEAMQTTFRPPLGNEKKLEESIYLNAGPPGENTQNQVEILDHSEVWLPI